MLLIYVYFLIDGREMYLVKEVYHFAVLLICADVWHEICVSSSGAKEQEFRNACC